MIVRTRRTDKVIRNVEKLKYLICLKDIWYFDWNTGLIFVKIVKLKEVK
jgi:hypothetical protein